MGRIVRHGRTGGPCRLSVVIPSRDGIRGGNVQRLLEALRAQTRPPDEIVVAVGFSPCGRAHNAGAEAAGGEVLVFLDDDVTLGTPKLLERLIRTLESTTERIGIAGASQLPPPDAAPFARAVARGSPRAAFPVQSAFVDTDMATHACLAIRKETYQRAGGEPDDTFRADDQVLRARVRALGLRVGVAAGAWVHHPLPTTMRAYLTARFRDGEGAARDARLRPELIFDTPKAGSAAIPRVTPRWRRALRWTGTLLAPPPVPLGQMAFAAGYTSRCLR